MSSIVLQRFARVSMLGIDVEARTDLADEPVFEAEDLGRLLEYQRPRACRQRVRSLVDAGRLSWWSPSGVATENSADNSMVVETDPRPVDVFVVEHHGPVGTVVRTTEQLWLTERACLLVATASDTDRAWQVRTALVDFFVQARKQRASGDPRVLDEARAMVDEARAIRAEVVQALELDKRVRQLEQRRDLRPLAPPTRPNVVIDDEEQLIETFAEVLWSAGRDEMSAKDALARCPELARFGASSHALGIALRRMQGFAINGMSIAGRKDRKDVTLWRVKVHDVTANP